MVTELVENRLLIGCRVLQQGDAVGPAGHPPKFSAKVATVLAALILVQEEPILLQLVGQLLLLVVSRVLTYCIQTSDISLAPTQHQMEAPYILLFNR